MKTLLFILLSFDCIFVHINMFGLKKQGALYSLNMNMLYSFDPMLQMSKLLNVVPPGVQGIVQ